jgi:beta-lactamase regulating signal transducer with metallopeptidase domain
MYQAFLILMKINFVLLLFTGAYYLILKNFTFYNLNRFYLLFAIVFSSCYPFINLTNLFNQHKEKLTSLSEIVKSLNAESLIKQESLLDFWGVIVTVILMGIIAFMLRLMIQLYSLYQIHQNTEPADFNNFKIRRLNDKISPFSFWKTIYVNPSIYSETELKTILEHEKIHVNQLHTIDLLIAELSTVFYWFNPGIWLMKKAIKENIEFITDAKILDSGIDRKEYQYNLLTVNNLKLQTSVVNSFNFSDIKKRIKMMNARRSAKSKVLIYFMLLPLLLITCLAFTVSVIKKEPIEKFSAPKPPKGLLPIVIKMPREKLLEKSSINKNQSNKKLNLSVSSLDKKDLSVSNLLSVVEEEGKQGFEDTTQYNSSILLVKMNKISEELKKSVGGYKGIKVNDIQIKVTPNSSSANYTVKKIAVIKVNDSPDFNPKDSIKVTYYLNGKVIKSKNLNNLSKENIKSINIQKNKITGTGIIIESN